MDNELSFAARNVMLGDILFGNVKYSIPRYQRPYAWTEDQVSEFWGDLISTNTNHFLGSFIFNFENYKKTGLVDIIDGQQRILTLTILLAAIRDITCNIDKSKAEFYQRKDIAFEDSLSGELTYRVICGDSTRIYFQKYIQSGDHKIEKSEPTTKEEARIKSNYKYFEAKLLTILKEKASKSESIKWLDSLRQKAYNLPVIQIELQSEEDAYEIFETTNARGIDLTIADLLKNLIFKNIPARKDRDFAKDVWSEMSSTIQSTGTELKQFIRHYWISKHSFVTEKQLFRKVKSEITEWEEFLYHLSEASEDYNKLLEGGREEWKDIKYGAKIYESISAIRFMGVSQCHVLFLSILRNIKKLKTDPSRIFKLIEDFTFNYSVICKLPGNKLEKIYSKHAIEIEDIVSKETEKNIPKRIQAIFSQLQSELQSLKPPYEFFREQFDDIRYRNSTKTRQLIKYVLSKINDLDSTGEQKIDFDKVNIEHILPQKPNKGWGLSKDEIRDYVHRIGNLTLVGKKFNSRVGNKPISDKLMELAKTELPITRKLVMQLKDNGLKWSEKEILKRHDELAKISYFKAWKF